MEILSNKFLKKSLELYFYFGLNKSGTISMLQKYSINSYQLRCFSLSLGLTMCFSFLGVVAGEDFEVVCNKEKLFHQNRDWMKLEILAVLV